MIQKAKPYLRRFFALFLVACLMVGYIPTGALAESPDTATETTVETVTDNTQESDASAETPPQDNGGEAE